jgi:5-methylcytosine-specific restriction endonuclease McrA
MPSVAAARIDPRGSARRSPTAGNREQGGKWLHPTTRRRIYERDHWQCVWCMCHVTIGLRILNPELRELLHSRDASIDHVVPRSRGGSNNSSNLITCCVTCNAKRGDRSVPAFAMFRVTDNALYGHYERERINKIIRRVRNAQRRKLPVHRERIVAP